MRLGLRHTAQGYVDGLNRSSANVRLPALIDDFREQLLGALV